jgi:hypothetical protein
MVELDHDEPLNVNTEPSASVASQEVDVEQEMATKSLVPSMSDGVCHELPSNFTTLPEESVASHSVDDDTLTHESPDSDWLASATAGEDHVDPSHERALPTSSVATQSDDDGQETAVSPLASMLVADDQDPLVSMATSPAASTATQSLTPPHETASGTASVSMDVAEDQPAPLYVKAFPSWSTATQSVVVAHETAVNAVESAEIGVVHAVPLYVRKLPTLSTARQNVVDGQLTPVIPLLSTFSIDPPETETFPLASTRAQSVVDAQEMDDGTPWSPSIDVGELHVVETAVVSELSLTVAVPVAVPLPVAVSLKA